MAKASLGRITVIVGALALALAASANAQTPTPTPAPLKFYAVTPCRLVDTRGAVGTNGGPALAGGAGRNFQVTSLCGVPTTAKAASLNVTLITPTKNGFIMIWPFNGTVPTVSTINAAAGEPAIANGAIVPLTTDPNFNISVVYGTTGGGTAHLAIDVTGYFQ
jgi:hypothetical protein